MNLPSEQQRRAAGVLLRYVRTALSVGRIPSPMGMLYVPARTRSRPHSALEDAVVFVCDIELCLEMLAEFDRHIVAFCIYEHHSEWEAARHFQKPQPEISRRLSRSLERLHAMFCQRGILQPMPEMIEPQESFHSFENRKSKRSTYETEEKQSKKDRAVLIATEE
jgi:hypothetical protein